MAISPCAVIVLGDLPNLPQTESRATCAWTALLSGIPVKDPFLFSSVRSRLAEAARTAQVRNSVSSVSSELSKELKKTARLNATQVAVIHL